MKPVVIITAKSFSSRLNNKNMLPLGGKVLSEYSLIAAQQIQNDGVVVSTDIEDLKKLANQYGYGVIHQNYESKSHSDVINDAINFTNNSNKPIVLLQPTSPFRTNDIVKKCWNLYVQYPDHTILTASQHHYCAIKDNTIHNSGDNITLWDGCVAIYPPNKICDYSKVKYVRNSHVNSLQIDTIEDYILACELYENFKPIDNVLSSSIYNLLRPVFRSNNIFDTVTLVTRQTQQSVPQDHPVIYVNHCDGYDGNRCDGLFIIANPHITTVGISNNLRECAKKCKFAIVRHNGELDWLINNLPEIRGKFYPLRDAISLYDDHLTTGCIAADVLYNLGLRVNMLGIYNPNNITKTLDKFHFSSMSREIALFNRIGAFDK